MIGSRQPVPAGVSVTRSSGRGRAQKEIFDFSEGQNTRDLDISVTVRAASNVRLGRSAGFSARPGQTQKGSDIGAAGEITGLHSYVKKDNTAYLLASWGTDIYQFVEAGVGAATVATSTNAQATGYGKDRHSFITANVDANGKPYLVTSYQSGSGILLEWSAYPYSSWANTPVTIDTTTQIGWSFHADGSDNIHVAFSSDANTVKYVKLTFAAGPTWSVGTKTTVAGSGASDRAFNPTIARQSAGRLHVAYTSYNGSTYVNKGKLSEDNGTTWATAVTLGTPGSAATYAIAAIVLNDTPYFVTQEDTTGAGTAYGYNQYVWNGNYLYQAYLGFYGAQTNAQFSLTPNGTSLTLTASSATAPDGIASVAFGGALNGQQRDYSVAVDGGSDSDIQFKNVVNGAQDVSFTRATNDTNRNRYPSVPLTVSAASSYVPVTFQVGTASPFTVKVTSSVQWSGLGTTLTAGSRVESATMPNTAAGGTDSIYFVNGSDAPRKWDGTTVTAATATGFPVARHVVAFDGRLWFFGPNNRAYYTNLGSDNFTGTFPGTNTVDFPEYLVGGYSAFRGRLLLVFTSSAVYKIQNFDYTGASVGPETIQRVPNSYGTLSIRTVKQIGSWIYYQSPDGMVRRTNGEYVEEPGASDIVRPTVGNLSLTQLSRAASGVTNDYYKNSVAGPGSGTQDTVLVLDTAKAPRGGWSVDDGQSVSCFVTHPDSNGLPQLFAGDSLLGRVYRSEYGTTDAGTAVAWSLTTGSLFGGGYFPTKLRDTMLLADTASGQTVTVGIAPLENADSFIEQTVDLDGGDGIWGSGTWGTGTWGGSTGVQARSTWGTVAAGWKTRVRGTGPASVSGITVSYETVRNAI